MAKRWSVVRAGVAAAVTVGSLVAVAGPSGAATMGADPAWNAGHGVALDIAGDGDFAEGVVVQSDGKVVTAGRAWVGDDFDGVVVRHDADGSLDPTFGDGGVLLFDGGYSDFFDDVALEPDGDIVLVGETVLGPTGNELVARLLPDGTPDPTFGPDGDGVVIGPEGELRGVVVTPTGDLVVSGWGVDDPADHIDPARQSNVTLRRYSATGVLDPDFGAMVDSGSDATVAWGDEPFALTRLGDGSFVAVGRRSSMSSTVPSSSFPLVVRFTPAGDLDTAFGGTGYRSLDDFPHSHAIDVLGDAGGRMVVGIWMPNDEYAVVRLLPDGSTDPTFGPVHRAGNLGALARDPEGRIAVLVGGRTFSVTRLTADGQVDAAFGQPTIDTFGDNEFVADGVVLDDGRILVAGYGYPTGGRDPVSHHYDSDLALVRFAPVADPPPPTTTTAPAPNPPDGGGGGGTAAGTPPAPTPPPPPTTTPPPAAGGATTGGAAASRSGYWMLGRDGVVHAFGDATARGGAPTATAVDLAATPTGNGYWVVDRSGTVTARGDAPALGNASKLATGEAVVSMATTPTGKGYWLVTDRGRALAFGDAARLGDLAGTRLNAPIIDAVATPTGKGLYLVAGDGGVFTFGDARFLGSMGAHRLNAPVRGLVPDPDGRGYWLVASDGGVFGFDAPFRGSLGNRRLNAPITGMIAYGNGYLMTAADGGAFVFSDRPFRGSLGGQLQRAPIVAITALP